MELNKLYYFYIVAKHEHVTKASEELHISQPALTKTIKQLQEELGVLLFKKDKRNIRLTEFGKLLKAKLEGVFDVLAQIPSELDRMKGFYENTIRLNVLAASGIVTEAIVEFKKLNENAIFQVIQNEEEDDCDITVTTNCKFAEFEKTSTLAEEIYLAVPKAWQGEDAIYLEDFSEEGFVNLAGSRLFRNICDELCQRAGFRARSIFESDSIVAVKNIIGVGAGIGFWPDFSWGECPEDIRLLKIKNLNCKRDIVIGRHKIERESCICEDFYEFLIQFMKRKAKNKSC